MTKFYKRIVDHQNLIIVVFLILFAVCAACQPLVAVNYDMNGYLPKESPSTIALDLMEQEYSGGIPNARVMVQDVTIPQALEYKEQLLTVDGVTDMTWLDDVASVTVPLETLDPDTVESYYKDGNALFSVTIAKEKRITAVDAIRQIIGDGNAMTGSAVSTAVATTSTVNEISTIAMISVAFVLVVLILTTTSFAEPFLVLAGLGVAVAINASLQQTDHGHRVSGAMPDAVSYRPRSWSGAGKGRGPQSDHCVHLLPALILKTYR